MKNILIITTTLILSGCTGANISSQIRENDTTQEMITRCVQVDTGSSEQMNSEIKQYDGWRMVYISEYTTANKMDTAAVMCFEKQK